MTHVSNNGLDNPCDLLNDLRDLREAILEEGDAYYHAWLPQISRLAFRDSARNLANYLALRHHDVRTLQQRLRPWGLSSLGRIEGQVAANLDAVIATLSHLCGGHGEGVVARPTMRDFNYGKSRLDVRKFGQRENHDGRWGAFRPVRRNDVRPLRVIVRYCCGGARG